MYNNTEDDDPSNQNKIIYFIKLVSVSIKIKFPCKMYLTQDSTQLTSEADLNVQNINHVTQQRNVFQFNETIRLQKPLSEEKEDFVLTVHLRTLKGSNYQAGLVKISQREIIDNEGNNKVVRTPVVKSLDAEAFCLFKVEKVEVRRRSRVEELYRVKVKKDGLKQQQNTSSRVIEKNTECVEATKMNKRQKKPQHTVSNHNNKRISLNDMASSQQHSIVYQTSQQQSSSQANNLISYLNQQSSSQRQQDSRLSIQLNSNEQNKQKSMKKNSNKQITSQQLNQKVTSKIQRRKTQQLQNLQSTKNYSQGRIKSPSVASPNDCLSPTYKQNNQIYSIFGQYEREEYSDVDRVEVMEGKGLNGDGQGIYMQDHQQLNIEPFTVEQSCDVRQEKGMRKYQSLAMLNDRKYQRAKQMMRKSIMRTSSYANTQLQSSSHNNNNSSSHNNNKHFMRTSKLLQSNSQLSSNMRSPLLHSKHLTPSTPYNNIPSISYNQNCPTCPILHTSLCQQLILSQNLNKKLQLIKLQQSQSNYLKQQSLLKQQSIYLLQQKLKQSVNQNLSLQEMVQAMQLEKIKVEKMFEEKELLISEVKEEFEEACGELTKKDRVVGELQQDIKRMKREVWQLRKELMEKDDAVSMKELEDMRVSSKHKREMAELSDRLNREKQQSIQAMRQQYIRLEQNHTKLSDNYTKLSKNYTKLQQQHTITQTQLLTLKQQSQSLIKQNSNNQQTILKLEQQLSHLIIKVQNHEQIKTQQIVSMLIKELEQERKVNGELRSELDQINKQYSEKGRELSGNNVKGEKQVVALRQQLGRVEEEYRRQGEQSNRVRCENNQLQQYITKLQQQITKQQQQTTQLQNHITTLQLHNTLLNQQLTNLTQQTPLSSPSHSQYQPLLLKQLQQKQLELQGKVNQIQSINNSLSRKQHENLQGSSNMIIRQHKVVDEMMGYELKLAKVKADVVEKERELTMIRDQINRERKQLFMVREEVRLLRLELEEWGKVKSDLTLQLNSNTNCTSNNNNSTSNNNNTNSNHNTNTNHYTTKSIPQPQSPSIQSPTSFLSSQSSFPPPSHSHSPTTCPHHQSHYKQLLRKKQQQLQLVIKQLQQCKLQQYKSQKHYRTVKQQLVMKDQQKKILLQQILQQKGRYGKLLSSRNQVQMTNSRLSYDLKQLKEQKQRVEAQLRYINTQLQQTIKSTIDDTQRQLTIREKQLNTLRQKLNQLELQLSHSMAIIEKHKKEEKLMKDTIEKEKKEKISIIKEKAKLLQTIENKNREVQSLKKDYDVLQQSNYAMVLEKETLAKKLFVMERAVEEGKQEVGVIKKELRCKQVQCVQMKQLIGKFKRRMVEVARVMLERMQQQCMKQQRLVQSVNNYIKTMNKSLPQPLLNKLPQFLNPQHLNHTFFINSQSNLTFYHKPQHQQHQASLSSIIPNTQNLQPLSPSKVFGSISVIRQQQLYLPLGDSQKLIELRKSRQQQSRFKIQRSGNSSKNNNSRNHDDENVLLNQSLRVENHLVPVEGLVLADNSFGNIVADCDEAKSNSNQQHKQTNHQSILIDQKPDSHILTLDQLQLNHHTKFNNPTNPITNNPNPNYNSSLKDLKIKPTRQLPQLNIRPNERIVEKPSQQNVSYQSRIGGTRKRGDLVMWLRNIVRGDEDDELMRRVLEDSCILDNSNSVSMSNSSIIGSNKNNNNSSNNNNNNSNNTMQHHPNSLHCIPHDLNSTLQHLTTYFTLLIQQHQSLSFQLSQQSTVISKHLHTISELQQQLQNQQIQFNEWMRDMEQNLVSGNEQRQRQYFQIKRQYLQLKKQNHYLTKQLNHLQTHKLHLQNQFNIKNDQLQETFNKLHHLQSTLQQKHTELNQLHYQTCLNEEAYQKELKLLNQKLSLANHHVNNLEAQLAKVEAELPRMKREYQSMLEYSEQQKIYLRERISMIQHQLQDQKDRRIKAERLDNFEQANHLYLQNERLKAEIMKLKRENNFRQVSTSMIIQQKDTQLNIYKEMVRSVQLPNRGHQDSPSEKMKNQIVHVYHHPQKEHTPKKMNNEIIEAVEGEYDEFLERPVQYGRGALPRINPFLNSINGEDAFVNKSQNPSQHIQSHNQSQQQDSFQHQIRQQHNQKRNQVHNSKTPPLPTRPHKLSFQANNMRHVDSIDSEKADELQQIIRKLKNIENKEQQFKQKLKKEDEVQVGLGLLKGHKMKRIQSIYVDLEGNELSPKKSDGKGSQKDRGVVSRDGRDMLFIHREENEMDVSMEEDKQQHMKQHQNDKKDHYQDLQHELTHKLQKKQIHPPPIMTYSNHYYKSPFMDDQAFDHLTHTSDNRKPSPTKSSPKIKTPSPPKQPYNPTPPLQQNIKLFKSQVNQCVLQQMRHYAQINIVTSQEEIQIQDMSNSNQLSQNKLGFNRAKKASKQQDDKSSARSIEDIITRQNYLKMREVNSYDPSEEPIILDNEDHQQQLAGHYDHRQISNATQNSMNRFSRSQHHPQPFSIQKDNHGNITQEEDYEDLVKAEFERILD